MARVTAGILEGLAVLAASAVLAAGGNALYGGDRIVLHHDYFPPKAARPERPRPVPDVPIPPAPDHGDPQPGDTTPQPGDTTPQPEPGEPTGDEYSDSDWFTNLDPAKFGSYRGLAYVPAGQSPSWEFNELTSPQALAFHTAGRDAGVVFVDARTPEHFEDGHIPGAVSLSHFHFPKYWPTASAEILAAGAVVLYCNGGDCDDSENLARTLILDGGIPQDQIYIYRGGVHDWTQAKRPLDTGSK